MYKGTVLVTLNVRPQPDGLPVLFKLFIGDKVETPETPINGWWRLTKVTRGTNVIRLPSTLCYAYEGASNGYIRLDESTTPPVDPTDPAQIGYPDKLIVQVPNSDGSMQEPVEYARVPK